MMKSICSQIILFILISFSIRINAQSFGYVSIGGGGYVTSVISSPTEKDLFYAKTDVGGIFRWQAQTQDWKPLFGWVANNQTSYLGVEALAIDPKAPNKLYALVGTSYWDGGKSAILRSEDYGETFRITDVTSLFKANGNGGDRQKGETLVVDPNKGNILFCGTRYNNGLYKSTDSGVSWQKVTTLNVTDASISFVAFDARSATAGNSTQTIYVGVFREGTDNIYVSKDGGNTWNAIGGHSAGKPNRCAISGDGNLYVTYSGTAGAVKKYHLDNGIWTDCTPPIGWVANRGFSGIDVDRIDPKKVVATTYNWWQNQQPWGWADAIYYSEDGGETWKEKVNKNVATMDVNGIPWIHGAIHWAGCATFDPFRPGWVFVVSGNGVFVSENIAAPTQVWKFMSKGLEETVLLDLISVPGGPLISSVGDQGGFVHNDILKYPLEQITQSSGFAFAGKKTNIIARVATDLYLSEDNAVTWNKLPATPDGMTKGKVAVSSDGKTIVWKSTKDSQHKAYYTNNKGVSWTVVNGINFDCIPMADPVNPLKFYAYNSSSGYFYVSKDGGKSFVSVELVGNGGVSRFAAVYGKEGNIWIAMKGNGLRYSINSGESFQAAQVYSSDAVAIGKELPGTTVPTVYIYGRPTITDVIGIYLSKDSGKTWERADDDQHQFGHLANGGLIEADRNVYGRVYRSTAGMGIPYIETEAPNPNPEPEPEPEPVIPAYTMFPNPFSNTVSLSVGDSPVNMIQIYDLKGSLIKVINYGQISNQTIEFGEDLNAGFYLVKIMGSNTTEVRKVIKR